LSMQSSEEHSFPSSLCCSLLHIYKEQEPDEVDHKGLKQLTLMTPLIKNPKPKFNKQLFNSLRAGLRYIRTWISA